MSIHYLIDPFTTNGDIIDVVTSESGQTDSTGATVIRIPDGVAIHNNPTNLPALLTAKYAGLLASYAGFTQIAFDPCMNTGVGSSKTALISAGFVNHALMSPSGNINTVITPLPFAPTQCILVWETYTYTDTNDKNGRFQRVYTESDPSDLQANISLNGGATGNFVSEGAVFNVPVVDQGSSLKIIFSSSSLNRTYLGSWALIF
jgi:hypothetical protein